MTWLTRDEVLVVVEGALTDVADFSGNCETFDFSKFQPFHKLVFINAIARLLEVKGYSVTLSIGKLDDFAHLKDLIDYIKDEQGFEGPPPPKLTLP